MDAIEKIARARYEAWRVVNGLRGLKPGWQWQDEFVRGDWIADTRREIATANATGFAMVPREPTEAMLFKAQNFIAAGPQFKGTALTIQREKMKGRWAAMLSAGEVRHET